MPSRWFIPLGIVLALAAGGCRLFTRLKKFRQELDAAIDAHLRLMIGPETDSWPEQPVDAETKRLLDLGLRTARARKSLLLRAETTGAKQGSWVELRWQRPNWFRIESDQVAVGEDRKTRQTLLRPNNNEWWIYNFRTKALEIAEWEEHDDRRALRMEPFPWLFPDQFDLRRRRWKIERGGATKEEVHLILKPANKKWERTAEVWLDPKTGMPTRYLDKNVYGEGNHLDLRVTRIEENAASDDSVFKPWTPDPKEGWKGEREKMKPPGRSAERASKIPVPSK